MSNMTILLVEDNDINRVVATEILAESEVMVDIAHNGLEALESLQKKSFSTFTGEKYRVKAPNAGP